MAGVLPYQATCCESCETPTTVNVPGPTGAAGAAGAAGSTGQNAYTATTADFVVPAVAASVTISVTSSSWATTGQVLYIAGAGYYTLTNKPSSTSMTVQNLGYTGNAVAATNITAGAPVGPGGLEGDAGTVAGTAVGGDLAGTLPNPTLSMLTANGSLITRAAGVNSEIGIGTLGHVLQVRSAGGVLSPTWAQIDLSGTYTAFGSYLMPHNGGLGSSAVAAAETSASLNPILPTNKANGDLFYYNGTALARLPIGTAGQFLSIAAGIPAWSASSATAAKRFKAFLGANVALIAGAQPAAINFDKEATDGTVEGFDPDATYATGLWTPGVVGNAQINVSVLLEGSQATAYPCWVMVYKSHSAVDYLIAHGSSNSIKTGNVDSISVSTITQVENVADYFFVNIYCTYAATLYGSTTYAYSQFSGFTF